MLVAPPPLEDVVRATMLAGGPRPQSIIASGYFINTRGDLLTNAHAVVACRELYVVGPDRDPVPATLLAVDTRIDAAILRVKGVGPVPYLSLRSGLPDFGGTVSIIGFPSDRAYDERALIQGGKLEEGPTGRRSMLVVSADLDPGQSGSPIIGPDGYVSAMVVGRMGDNRNLTVATTSDALARFVAYAGLADNSGIVPIQRFQPIGTDMDQKWLPGSPRLLMNRQVLENMSGAVTRVECR